MKACFMSCLWPAQQLFFSSLCLYDYAYICQDLEQLAAELRADIVHTVSDIGGHLGSSLGVVELSVALHHVFNSPEDKIIWDVGHQVSLCFSSLFLILNIKSNGIKRKKFKL